ncbi:Succinate-semialdehyde dehydrogenase [Arachis hypogaea]|nr:Succinate-semialdehyde dehydrogenase [Arachis hypogaea]
MMVGAVNVVMRNAPEIVDALLTSPQIRKITFTCTTVVGKKLMAGSAETVKKNMMCLIWQQGLYVMLEPETLRSVTAVFLFVVVSANLKIEGCPSLVPPLSVMKILLAAKYRNSGQTCVCEQNSCARRLG